MADGAERVLKVAIPGRGLAAEAAALAAAGGRGYVRLLAHDAAAEAMLLEALGPALEWSGRSPADQVGLAARVLQAAWRPVAEHEQGLAAEPTTARGLAELVRTSWSQHGRPCPAAVVDQALGYADLLAAAHVPQRCVWVHGDPHPGNLLTCASRPGAAEGYVFVDPEPEVGDPAYDLGVLLRDWSRVLLSGDVDPQGWLRQRCAELAAATGADPEAIWRWAFLERVSTGLYVHSFGAERVARPFLDSAALLLP